MEKGAWVLRYQITINYKNINYKIISIVFYNRNFSAAEAHAFLGDVHTKTGQPKMPEPTMPLWCAFL
jgi:hypothetical protein